MSVLPRPKLKRASGPGQSSAGSWHTEDRVWLVARFEYGWAVMPRWDSGRRPERIWEETGLYIQMFRTRGVALDALALALYLEAE